ncbi:MAG TPA: RluA family pseudouridine synthase [bacterium]|nr:RluA family pseudouridine synthase [bacterium]
MSSLRSSSTEDAHAAAGGPAFQRHLVAPEQAGQRLDRVLGALPGITSRQMAQRLISQGQALLNGAPADPDRRVQAADVIDYRQPVPEPLQVRPQPAPPERPLRILHEDAWLVVVDKPAGLPMHPGPGHCQDTLVNYLLYHCRDLSGIGGTLRPGIVHRLDLNTSGVVVVAKSDAAHAGLAAQFKAHTVERAYVALVLGQPQQPKGTIRLPIGRHPQQRMRRAVVPEGRHAVTHWWVEQRLPPFSLLRLRLETGRTHQIRVHLAAQGWPVVGDPVYGSAHRLRSLPLAPALREQVLAFRRQALHAAELGFIHPGTGRHMHFSSPLPEDFRELLRALVRRATPAE